MQGSLVDPLLKKERVVCGTRVKKKKEKIRIKEKHPAEKVKLNIPEQRGHLSSMEPNTSMAKYPVYLLL